MMDKKDAIDYLLYMKHDVQAKSPMDIALDTAIEALKQPTIEPEVRHGHWEDIPGMNNTVFCSECLAAANKELAMKYKGCPFCLARMDGGAGNGD